MRPAKPVLTDQELEIMKVIWDLGSATVRDVYEAILERRKIAYTTVMTMMKILEQKGHLRRKMDDRAYVYQPTRSKQQVVRGMVREFVDRVFNGSAQPLLLHLIEDRQLSQKELDEIAAMIPREAGAKKADTKKEDKERL
ncbi:MAG TPA: BlaI/MecI/CopY family transcriptional regulator [Bryobacteraceae bacterium]|nr:BlaI/MecI/CopY family transcriptional regulator [Bryobacteraceae bacterium]